ncbi:hypothetical protein [Paenibacillus hubeiensis]|uniref:hypothetical protein n=1 Tax=Paenibacillus hubeiensis TaxID=3077330 RepID=UPI0031BAA638
MNISSMIRGILGDSKPGNAKPLELKEGQVVRGSVVSVSEDGGDAVLQIQGVQVRAKLETPLRAGETTLLQVQPPGENGMTVMKPLAGSLSELPQASMNQLLQDVGLPDTKGNRELLIAMQRSGLPLTKDNVTLVQNMLAAKPAQVPAEEWVQATGIAFQRGLPVTAETVKGLHQAVFGPPLHQLLSGLTEQLESLLSQMSGKTPGKNGEANGKVVAPTTAAPMTGSAEAADNGTAAGGSRAAGGPAAAAQQAGAAPVGAATTVNGAGEAPAAAAKPGTQPGVSGTEAGGAKAGTVAGGTENAGKGGIPAGTGIPGSSPQDMDADSPGLGRPAGTGTAGEAAGRVIDGQAGAAGRAAGRGEGPAAAGAGPVSPAAAQAAPAAPTAAELAPRLLALLDALRGASTAAPAQPGAASQAAPAAQQGGQAAAAAGGSPQPVPAGADAPPAGPAAAPAGAAAGHAPVTHEGDPWVGRVLKLLGAEHEQQAVHGATAQARAGEAASPAGADSLKGLLLQLASSDGAPAALKDAAVQAVQYLTGQQLLLTTDRNSTFAQMHWFIPIIGPDGEETASVQIQSRRGQRGELDAANCRLWFDLNMKNLGPTLVDVQVVNHIVSLRVLNDREGMGPLLEGGRQLIHQALDQLGYQLLSFRTEPWPADKEPGGERKVSASDYSPDRYKGVDVKI